MNVARGAAPSRARRRIVPTAPPPPPGDAAVSLAVDEQRVDGAARHRRRRCSARPTRAVLAWARGERTTHARAWPGRLTSLNRRRRRGAARPRGAGAGGADQLGGWVRPSSAKKTATCRRPGIPSLRNTAVRCALTVRSVTENFWAMSLL